MKYGAVNIIELLIKYRTVLPDCVDHTRPMVWESTYRKSILAHFFHATLYLQSSEKYPKVHGQVNIRPVKCGKKLLIHSQTSAVAP